MERMRRGVRRLLVAAGVAASLFAGVAASPTDEGTWISYTGTIGAARAAAAPTALVTVTCVAEGACSVTLAAADGSAGYTWPATARGDGLFDGAIPPQGDPCTDDTALPAGVFSLAADPAAAVLTLDLDDSAIECDEGSRSYADLVVRAEFSDGYACVLTGIPCPPAAPPAAPETGDAGVTTAAPDAAPTDEAPAQTPGGSEPGARGLVSGTALATGDPAAPSILWTLPTVAQAPLTAIQLALAALVTIVLVLLVAFPTALLNSAVEAAPERIAALFPRRAARPAPTRSHRPFGAAWWYAAVGVLAAAVIAGFVDPEFGGNPGSVRVILGIVIGFAIDVVLGWSVVIAVSRTLDHRVVTRYRFAPLSLVVVIAAVAFTRLTGFEPGIVFGLVAGVVVGGVASVAVRGKAAIALAAYSLGVGLAAWGLYSLLGPILAPDASLGEALAVDALSATAIAGIAACPIVLVPLRGLAGGDVFAWSRPAWAALYALALFAFVFVLMPLPFSWAEVALSLLAWIWMYAAYALVAVAAWLAIARPWRSGDDGDASTPQPTGHGARSRDGGPTLEG